MCQNAQGAGIEKRNRLTNRASEKRILASRTNGNSPAVRAAISFRHLADNSRVLDLAQRHETAFDRQFSRARLHHRPPPRPG